MAKMLPELDERDQRSILGGTSTGAYPEGYTGSVAVPITGYTDADPYGVTGEYTSSDFQPTGEYATGAVTGRYYSFEEMDEMIDEGKWTGGWVEGLGYVQEAILITGYYTGSVPEDGSDDSSSTDASSSSEQAWYVAFVKNLGGGSSQWMPEGGVEAVRDNLEVDASAKLSGGNGLFIPSLGLSNTKDLLNAEYSSNPNANKSSSIHTDLGIGPFSLVYDPIHGTYSLGFNMCGAECDIDWDRNGNPSVFIGVGVGVKLGFLLQGEVEAKMGVRIK